MNHGHVEFGAGSWGGVLCSKNIADSRPGDTGFANLRTNCLNMKVRVGSRSGELVAVGIGELGSRLQVVLVSG